MSLNATPAPARDELAILRARAKAMARPAGLPGSGHGPDDDFAHAADTLEVLEFRLASERYAVETRFVQEVHPLVVLTPLPCTPDFVLGIVNVRSQVVTVLNLKRFFDLPEEGLTDLHRIVLIGEQRCGDQSRGDQIRSESEIGLLADMAVAVRRIPRALLQAPLATRIDIGAHFVQGVTPDGVVVLEISRVLADPKLLVDEEPHRNEKT